MITLTESADQELKVLLEKKGASGKSGLRLGVERGGCAGFQYAMQVSEKTEGDEVIEQDGARVFLAADSLEPKLIARTTSPTPGSRSSIPTPPAPAVVAPPFRQRRKGSSQVTIPPSTARTAARVSIPLMALSPSTPHSPGTAADCRNTLRAALRERISITPYSRRARR